MSSPTRLGGFKVLKDMIIFSIVISKSMGMTPSGFLKAIANRKINLPFLTLFQDGAEWGMNAMVDSSDGMIMSFLIEEKLGKDFLKNIPDVSILSIFPHKKNPEITGSLFSSFHENEIHALALATSPSAISIVIDSKSLSKASGALFQPFSFGAYRTPADWKLAQKGKEELHKEIVASFQEQKPKVYGLEYHDDQLFIGIRLNNKEITDFGNVFREFAENGMSLTFTASGSHGIDKDFLFFCLDKSSDNSFSDIFNGHALEIELNRYPPVAVFSMNGPHFGDRYGIASELVSSLERKGIDLLGLNCTIASITGVVLSTQIKSTITAVQKNFQVPAILNKD